MSKRTHERIRNAILIVLSDGKERSFGYLERKVNTNWQTIRNHCKNLELFGIVSISDRGESN